MENITLVELNKDNINQFGTYCLRSKQKTQGYINKVKWMLKRFDEGLKYILLQENEKTVGFIEFMTAEKSWRVVNADNYIVIHCLWINITGKGFGTYLINKCIEQAKRENKYGVVVITNSETSWLPSKNIFLKNNFSVVDKSPYSFELLVYKLDNYPDPYFPSNWNERLNANDSLTIFRSYQCPYVEIATENILVAAKSLNIETKIIDIETRSKLLELSPTPQGVFNVIYKGQLVTFHRLTVHSVIKKLKEIY